MRLIDADALEKELSKRWDISDDQDFCNKEVWDALRNAPTVQADRPMGEFEICGNSNGLNGTMYYICSLCGTPIDPCDKFCRGCGAYMKGGAE